MKTFVQVRNFSHPMWNKKTRKHFKPTYFDNANYNLERRWDAKERNFMYRSQDPLFFDYDKLYLNGGITPYIEKVRAMGREIPVNKRAYILYHMAKQKVYDPTFFELMEEGLILQDPNAKLKKESTVKGENNITARYAMGAVIGYWRMNGGSAWALQYWMQYLEQQAKDLHIADVIELCQAFKENRTHHR